MLVYLTAAPVVSAAVLYDQTEGTSGVPVPSQESPDEPASTTQAADDVLVPPGEHWEVSEVEVPGTSPPGPHHFNVFLYEDGNWGPGRELFAERGISASGPSYSLPLRGAPLLNPGTYWFSVQAVGLAAEPWSWETVNVQHGNWPAFWQNPGNTLHTNCPTWWIRESCLHESSGEPDQAFKLIGTFEQVLKSGYYGNSGGVTSSPTGISCPTTCSAAFDRGTVVTLTGFPLSHGMEFTGWRRAPGVPTSPTSPVPSPTDLPCSSLGSCQLTLNEDMTIYGTFWPANRIRLGKLKHNLAKGTADLRVRLPTAGLLTMVSDGTKKFRDPQAVAGTLRLPLVPRAWATRKLSRTGHAAAQLRIKFRPFGGRARVVSHSVVLRKQQHG